MRGSCWSAQAFGLTVRGDFAAPGLDTRREPPGPRTVDVRLADAGTVAARTGGRREKRWERRDAAGALVMRIDRTHDGARIIEAPGYGAFLVAAAGGEVLAAPAHGPAWRWQRYLIGQALPLAAVLQGLEVLHASAVVFDGIAVAFAGASGSGKTTLAAALLQEGAELLCDDVLALEPAGDAVVAHPGPPVVNLRTEGAAALRAPFSGGRVVGRDADAVRVALDAGAGAAPLVALYILDRSRRHPRLLLEPRPADAASLLLASSFNFLLTDPARLERQLDVCARLAHSASIVRACVPATMGTGALAEAMTVHAGEVARCAA